MELEGAGEPGGRGVPISWVVDVLSPSDGDWYIGHASLYFRAEEGHSSAEIQVDVEFDDTPATSKRLMAIRVLQTWRKSPSSCGTSRGRS